MTMIFKMFLPTRCAIQYAIAEPGQTNLFRSSYAFVYVSVVEMPKLTQIGRAHV